MSTQEEKFKDLTDQELFDKMISHHMKSVQNDRTSRSKWHHEKLYMYTKRLLWERAEENGRRNSTWNGSDRRKSEDS